MTTDLKQIEKETHSIVEQLLKLIGVSATLTIEATAADETNPVSVKVAIESEEFKGVLIGRRGEHIQAIQTFLTLSIKNRLGEWIRVVVDVGDWSKRQSEQLEDLAKQTAQRAIDTQTPQPLYNLTPAQRRVVHVFLSSDTRVTTESQGDGLERYLLVKPK